MNAIDKETIYWIFSTIAQTYGAIIGIIGMFAIFRLQSLLSRKETIIQQFEGHIFKDEKPVYGITEKLIRELTLDVTAIGFEYDTDFGKIDKAVSDLDDCDDKSGQIKIDLMFFFSLHIVFIIACIIGMFFSEYLSGIWQGVLAILILLFTFSCNLIFRTIKTLVDI